MVDLTPNLVAPIYNAQIRLDWGSRRSSETSAKTSAKVEADLPGLLRDWICWSRYLWSEGRDPEKELATFKDALALKQRRAAAIQQ